MLRRSGVLRLTRAPVDVHVIAVVMAAAPRTGAGMLAGDGVGWSLGLALSCTTPGAGMSAGTGVGWSLELTRMLAGAAIRV